MAITVKGTVFPPELADAVAAHAAAMVVGDEGGAAKFVNDRAAAAFGAAIKRGASMRPFTSYEVIARARLGFQYIVKVRAHGTAGDLTLQNRWHKEDDGNWRIVEIEDLGLQSPWKKPEKVAAAKVNG
jgi:hypothetical protein